MGFPQMLYNSVRVQDCGAASYRAFNLRKVGTDKRSLRPPRWSLTELAEVGTVGMGGDSAGEPVWNGPESTAITTILVAATAYAGTVQEITSVNYFTSGGNHTRKCPMPKVDHSKVSSLHAVSALVSVGNRDCKRLSATVRYAPTPPILSITYTLAICESVQYSIGIVGGCVHVPSVL